MFMLNTGWLSIYFTWWPGDLLMPLQQEPVISKENMAWDVFLGYQRVTEDLGLCDSAFDSFCTKLCA